MTSVMIQGLSSGKKRDVFFLFLFFLFYLRGISGSQVDIQRRALLVAEVSLTLLALLVFVSTLKKKKKKVKESGRWRNDYL